MYTDDDLLMLSGIQHMAFCPRQWAMIHIEQQWAENRLTVEGHHLHERVDDPFITDSRKKVVTYRSLAVVSYKLGLYGMADLVEFFPTDNPDNATSLAGKSGFWQPIPIEYKRGKPKHEVIDEVQLCAQAICLEEMYNLKISEGFLYYGETRHRFEVAFDDELRKLVEEYSSRMHYLFEHRITPPAEYAPCCKSCSLINECLPKQMNGGNAVNDYLKLLDD